MYICRNKIILCIIFLFHGEIVYISCMVGLQFGMFDGSAEPKCVAQSADSLIAARPRVPKCCIHKAQNK